MNHDAATLKVKPLEPGAPLDLAEARNAVELAKVAGADRYAADTFVKASRLLADAELAREKHKKGNEVQQPARQAAQTAEDARLIAMQRQDEEFQAAQRAAAAERERAAQQQTLAAQQAALEAQRRVQEEQEQDRLRQQLREQLNVVLETRETARGLIVNLSDVLFDTGSANLKPGAREKLARVAGILASHPDLHIAIEGHTDSVGGEDYNQRLSERRAESVQTYLVEQKVSPAVVGTAGFGESRPVATNGTAAGRQQNRRVEIVVSGESIGR